MRLDLCLWAAFTIPSFGTVVAHMPLVPLATTSDDGELIPIDIDGNGSIDFQFGGRPNSGTAFRTERANRYIGIAAIPPNLGGDAIPLRDNTMIRGGNLDGNLSWFSSDLDGFVEPDEGAGTFTLLTICRSTGCGGTFFNGSNDPQRSFLGLEFDIEGETHYGYFDLEFQPAAPGGTIHGWAYETQPNTAISTAFIPEPSSYLLILGWLAGACLRRKRQM